MPRGPRGALLVRGRVAAGSVRDAAGPSARCRRRAAVIGSGFGGLALAIRLQSAGIATTLLEKRDKPGGRAYVYEDQGFTFDAGPTVITAPDCLEELLTLAGRRLETTSSCCRSRRSTGSSGKTAASSTTRTTRSPRSTPDPREEPGGRGRATAASSPTPRTCSRKATSSLAHVPFLDFWSMIRVAPQLVAAAGLSHRLLRWCRASSRTRTCARPSASTRCWSAGNPFATSSIYTLIHCARAQLGRLLPAWRHRRAGRALVRLFQDLGGECGSTARWRRSATRDGRVTGVAGGRTAGAPASTSSRATPTSCTPTRTCCAHEPRGRGRRAPSLAKKRYQHVAVRHLLRHPAPASAARPPQRALRPALPRAARRHLRARHRSPTTSRSTCTRPTSPIPSLAPPGCEAFYVLSPVPHLGKAPLDWARRGAALPRPDPRLSGDALHPGPAQRSRHAPHLHARRLPATSSTPIIGSAFSLEPVLTQSAFFRVHNRDDRIRGLYFVGAGTHPGAGIPGVVGSAKATAGLMLEDLGIVERAAGARRRRRLVERCEAIIQRGLEELRAGRPALRSEDARGVPACSTPGAATATTRSTAQELGLRAPASARAALSASTGSRVCRTRHARALAGRADDRPGLRRLPARRRRDTRFPNATRSSCSRASRWTSRARRYATLDDTAALLLPRGRCGRRDDGHIMGARRRVDAASAPPTSGIALQLTNIARDVSTTRAAGASTCRSSGWAKPACRPGRSTQPRAPRPSR